MSREIDPRHLAVQKAGMAAEVGCDPAEFDRPGVAVVPLGAPKEPTIALAAWFGQGRVLGVDARLLEWARSHLGPISEAYGDVERGPLSGEFMGALAAEANRLGTTCLFHGTGIFFALEGEPDKADLPGGFDYRPVMADQRQVYRGSFPNSLETSEPLAYALGSFQGRSLLAAVGVIDHEDERYEIGIDVQPGARERGLARALVLTATRWILDRGKVPVYSCGATNLRSQRVALACGYVPVAVVSAVLPVRSPSPGDEPPS